MTRKFIPFLMLLFVALTAASCLNDNDDNGVTYTDDCYISAFALGNQKYTKDTVNASSGKDSTIVTTINASSYKFNINQLTDTIENPDSLPYGVDAEKIVTSLSAVGAGVAIKSLTSDSLQYYSSTDSINFTRPRTFRVYSNSGKAYRDYVVKVNIHTQLPYRYASQQFSQSDELAQLSGIKGVSCAGNIFVFGTLDGALKIYATTENDGNTWTAVEPKPALDASAAKNVFAYNNKIYTLSGGKLQSSADGRAWTEVADASSLKALAGTDGHYFYAISTSGKLMISTDEGASWSEDALNDDATLLPTEDLSICYRNLVTNANTSILTLIGHRADTYTDSYQTVWTRTMEYSNGAEPSAWNYVDPSANSYALAKASHFVAVNRNNTIYGFNGESFITSSNGGLAWSADTVATKKISITLPLKGFAMAKDSQNFVWIIGEGTGEVWRGRYNQDGWIRKK